MVGLDSSRGSVVQAVHLPGQIDLVGIHPVTCTYDSHVDGKARSPATRAGPHSGDRPMPIVKEG